jgi:SAM-dependent methyltransferase
VIVCHLHNVHELLTILGQPAAEMQILQALLTEQGGLLPMNDASRLATVPLLEAKTVDLLMQELQAYVELVDEPILQWARNYWLGHTQHYRDVITRVGQIIDKDDVKRVLDIGAVPGHISAMLKYAGLDVSAADIAPERASRLFETMKIPTYKVNLDMEPLPFVDESYDLVLFCEILEHLRLRPISALQQVQRVLRPGGHLLLSVPNITPLMRWRFLLGEDFQGDLVKEFEKIETIGHMGHFRLYSQREIERILSHIGFYIVDISRGGKPVPDKQWDARLLCTLLPNLMTNQLYVWARKSK